MKRELLLSAALCAVLNVFPQNANIRQQVTGIQNMKPLAKITMADESNTQMMAQPNNQAKPENKANSTSKTSALNTWENFSTSGNIYGVLISYCKPLQYNDELNAVTFIHRKPPSYVASPIPAANAANGLMLASITTDDGTTWDSTLIWNNDINWGRYPGGGIYNPQGNTNLSSAYIVGHGPTTNQPGGWAGNFFASKQLNTFDNIASTTPNAQQWMDITTPDPNVGRVDFAAYGFSTTDDGKVRALGGLTDDNAAAGAQDTAVVMVTGTFNSGVFNYAGTIFNPPASLASDGSDNWLSRPMMAWNEAGTVGYVAVVGQKDGSTGSNAGPQPMVWKSTNSGASWALIPSIDFSTPAYDDLKASLPGTVGDSTMIAPWFSWIEGMDMAVDANDKLHLFSSIYGAPRIHPDSVFYLYQFGTEGYRWLHVPGARPYLYDFMTDGTSGWSHITVDSMGTEGPAGVSTGNGFNYNPWDLNGADKTRIDARLQLSRTPDGKHIFYSWAESDTNFTSSAVKWNVLPNVKVRAYDVDNDTIFAEEFNITSPSTGVNPNVASRAMYHFMSPKSSTANVTAVGNFTSVVVRLPFTVSNNPGYNQLITNSHWYNSTELTFTRGQNDVNVQENAINSVNSSILYPNPSNSNSTTLGIVLKNNENVNIVVYNLVGQAVKAFDANVTAGENQIYLDLNGIEKGIYLVKIDVDGASSSKKLIIE